MLWMEDSHVLRMEDSHVLRMVDSHMLWMEDSHVLRRTLMLEVDGQRKKWRPRRTWKMKVEEEHVKVGLRREDAICRSNWIVGVIQIAAGLR